MRLQNELVPIYAGLKHAGEQCKEQYSIAVLKRSGEQSANRLRAMSEQLKSMIKATGKPVA